MWPLKHQGREVVRFWLSNLNEFWHLNTRTLYEHFREKKLPFCHHVTCDVIFKYEYDKCGKIERESIERK